MENQDNGSEISRMPRGRPREWYDKTAQKTIRALDQELEVLSAAPCERFTEFTLTTRKGLTTEMDIIRQQGFAVAGISASGSPSRVTEAQGLELGRSVIDVAKNLTAAIGGDTLHLKS